MITACSISGGDSYLSKHLRANDYYEEGKEVPGEWIGKGAHELGLEGPVEAEHFDRLRNNQHPVTGEQLTARKLEATRVVHPKTGRHEERKPIALHDITIGAPKAASIAALVGGDDRIVDAWKQSVRLAVQEMERFAAVRLRTGQYRDSEKLRVTGNVIGALFFHDSSRELDPQLHAHAVMANASYDTERGQWMALQRRAMMEASVYVREFLYQDFARRLGQLGYQVIRSNSGPGFDITGISEHAKQLFSARASQRLAFEQRYQRVFGHAPSKRRTGQFIADLQGVAALRFATEYKKAFGKEPDAQLVAEFSQDARNPKLTEISTAEVRQQQRQRLDPNDLAEIERTVHEARQRAARDITPAPKGDLKQAAQSGLDHCLERTSVPRLGDALASAIRFGSKQPGDLDPRGLYGEMQSISGAISDGYRISTEDVYREEQSIIDFAQTKRGQYHPLGDTEGAQMELLDAGQQAALTGLTNSRNGIAILIGDAGTGKTHTLKRFDEAYRHRHKRGVIALATNTQGATELSEIGYNDAKTVAAILCSDHLQRDAAGQAILIDEAGALSTKQMAQLVDIARAQSARLVLVGDIKQHESVERGNALRSIIDSKLIPAQRLTNVRRQQRAEHRKIAKLLADGQPLKALEHAESLGMVHEIPEARALFEKAVTHYADQLAQGNETLIVIPTWEDIDRFNEEARRELKARGLIRGEEIEIRGSASLSWTEVERCHWQDYQPGHVLNFHRAVSGMKAGEAATVKAVKDNGVVVERPDGSEVLIGRRQRKAFDVAESRPLKLAAGDELLFRANCKDIKVSNGDRLKVEAVDPTTGKVSLAGGKVLPTHFTQVSHGHAVTSHKSQGASVQASLLVVGPHSLGAANLRQFYVSNTRFKQDHRLFAHDLDALKKAVANRSERMLAREFVADLGKELAALLNERHAAKEIQAPNGAQIVEGKQREHRLRELRKDLAACERRAAQTAGLRKLWQKLGVARMPQAVRRWFGKRHRSAQHSEQHQRQRKAYHVWQAINRARRAHRSTGHKR